MPAFGNGISASAGVGSNSKGDFLDDQKAAAISKVITPIKNYASKKWTEFRNKTPETAGNTNDPGIDVAAAFAIVVDNNTATARIGDGNPTDHGGKKAIVTADGTISVTAKIENVPNISVSSAAKKNPDATAESGANKFAGSLAVAIGVYNNNAQAYINSDAEVDAKKALTVQAQALNDYQLKFGVNLVSPFLQQATFNTDDGAKLVKNGDIVEVRGGHVGNGDTGTWYKYIGAVPQRTIDLKNEDFSSTNNWESLGNAVGYISKNFVGNLTGYLNSNLGTKSLANSWSQGHCRRR